MVPERIAALRKLMKKYQVDAYLIPSTDAHQNEYLPEIWERRQWLSGFSGSAGDLLITQKTAGLWTDSRYFLQAEEQLKGSGIQLFKMGLPETPDLRYWLKDQLKSGDRVGIDSEVISCQQAENLKQFFQNWGLKLKPVKENLVDKIWKEQPDFPSDPVSIHPLKYAGRSLGEKLQDLRLQLKNENCQAHIITTLDSIAWLFNIRGTDIPYNPLVISYALVTAKKAFLFIPKSKVTKSLQKHLGAQVEILEYAKFSKQIKKRISKEMRVWLDPSTTSWSICRFLKGNCEIFWKQSPLVLMKAIKNKKEINGMKSAHIRDGIAMVKFLYWLENNLGKEKITEMTAAKKLEEIRAEQDLYQGPSFHTISAYGSHAAIVHYSAAPDSDVPLQKKGLYLIDSGGQYLDGTTDITRTLALGRPTAEQKDRFTRVLQGHIRLALSRFPAGTAGNQLDTIARKPLWDIGLNFGHGTGHGIGAYLNVHEGPQAISYYRGIGVSLEPGMIISNEPGFYKTGEYGIRTENLIIVIEGKGKSAFHGFETITLCPIDRKLINPSLMDEQEIQWLNSYHKIVNETLYPLLQSQEKEWLRRETQPL